MLEYFQSNGEKMMSNIAMFGVAASLIGADEMDRILQESFNKVQSDVEVNRSNFNFFHVELSKTAESLIEHIRELESSISQLSHYIMRDNNEESDTSVDVDDVLGEINASVDKVKYYYDWLQHYKEMCILSYDNMREYIKESE